MSEFSTDIQVRFRDIDAMGHVNNAVYATYVEQARTEYFEEILEEGLDAVSTVLASLELSYERPAARAYPHSFISPPGA